MIVDIDISYRADFVPKRARNVRKGHASERIAATVREVPSADAPAVLEIGHSTWKRTVRTIDGLLYAPPKRRDDDVRTTEEIVASLVADRMVETCLVPEHDRRIHALVGDATRVSTHRDPTVSHLAEWMAENVVLIDGALHTRVVSPMIPVDHLVHAFGKGAEVVAERTGSRFVPAWFPPHIDGESLTTAMNRLPKQPARRSEAKMWYFDVTGRMDARVLDEALFETVSKDPRNLDPTDVVAAAVKTFQDAPGTGIGTAYPGALIQLPHLLRAVAEREAEAGTSLADIEQRLRGIASYSTRPASPAPVEPSGGRLATLRLFVDDSPLVRTHEHPSAFANFLSDVPPLVFRLHDTTLAFDIAVAGAGRHAIDMKNIHSTDPEDVEFDIDGWNLKVAMAHVVARLDARIRLLPKHVVDAIAEVATHLRDWRADVRSVDRPELHEAFVGNASVVVDAMDGFVLEDAGDFWVRRIATSSCAASIEKLSAEQTTEEDPDLRSFAF